MVFPNFSSQARGSATVATAARAVTLSAGDMLLVDPREQPATVAQHGLDGGALGATLMVQNLALEAALAK